MAKACCDLGAWACVGKQAYRCARLGVARHRECRQVDLGVQLRRIGTTQVCNMRGLQQACKQVACTKGDLVELVCAEWSLAELACAELGLAKLACAEWEPSRAYLLGIKACVMAIACRVEGAWLGPAWLDRLGTMSACGRAGLAELVRLRRQVWPDLYHRDIMFVFLVLLNVESWYEWRRSHHVTHKLLWAVSYLNFH